MLKVYPLFEIEKAIGENLHMKWIFVKRNLADKGLIEVGLNIAVLIWWNIPYQITVRNVPNLMTYFIADIIC